MTTEFNSILDLQADFPTTSPSANDIAFVKGYYSSADGGEGSFYWDAASTIADNGGTIIQKGTTTTGRWIRMFKDEIQVKWFGAKGDCVILKDAAMTNGSPTLTSASASFSSTPYNGKTITVSGADSVKPILKTTISSVGTTTSITLAVNATNTVTSAWAIIYFTDDTAAIQAAIDFATAANLVLSINSGNYNITSALNLVSNSHIKGEDKTGAAIVSSSNTVSFTTNALPYSNITLKDFTLYGCAKQQLRFITNIMIDGLQVIDGFETAIYIFNSIGVTIQNCYVYYHQFGPSAVAADIVKKMGIRVEGESVSPGTDPSMSTDILITNNIVHNASDNGIAVRAIEGHLYRSIVSNNCIYNAGKAGIKNTIEITAPNGIEFHDAVISNNVINGWARYVNECAIDASNFQSSPTTDIRPVTNVAITGNAIRANHDIRIPDTGSSQTAYINSINQLNATISGNTCVGGVEKSGITAFLASKLTITGNVIEDACQGSSDVTLSSGGISVYKSSQINITGNTVKNTIGRPGIFLKESSQCVVNGNICFDSQTTPTQTYGIQELDITTSSAQDNKFGNNASYNNISVNSYSKRSIVSDATPVVNISSGITSNYVMDPHTTFATLPQLGSTSYALVLPSPIINNSYEYGSITIWNHHIGANNWTLPTGAVVNASGTVVTNVPPGAVSTFWFEPGTSKWVLV